MKAVVLVALLIVVFACVFATRTFEDYQEEYFKWIKKYNKTFKSARSFDTRFAIWKQNLDEIEAHNADKSNTYELECNEWCDLTFEEWKYKVNLMENGPQECSATARNARAPFGTETKVPDAIDWRDKEVVTPVKNQGGCGSCWAFSTTGCLESHWALKHKELLSLSEQQLVDCAGAFDNHGCRGGLPSHAFEYIFHAGGIQSGSTYPYRGRDEKCKFDKTKVVAKSLGSYNFTEGDEKGIYEAVGTIGPVSIAYQVVSDFRFYKSGVYQSKNCKNGPMDVNHAVLAVGYNTTSDGIPFFIVKNSWGTGFGMKGYFNIIRGKNMCGIATCASYPVLP